MKFNLSILLFFISILIGQQNQFAGSEACSSCHPDQYDSWMNCEDFEMMVPQYRLRTNDGAKDFGLERFGWEDFYVVFEHRDSCEDEETDRGVADFYFKVVVT